jgi:hypothetical protein
VYGLVQDLVVDISDITDESDIESGCSEPAAEDVEVHATSDMDNVRLSLHRRATEIDADLPRSDG